jgi:periplasmic divalent cation tolerance protein
MTALVCFCTCPDRDSAERLADALVAERLAACVNVLPGLRSVYRWQGAIERADEVMLVIKTVHERLDQVTARVAALHPHELPEVIAVEVAGGLAAYLDWVAECSADAGAADTAGDPGTSVNALHPGD